MRHVNKLPPKQFGFITGCSTALVIDLLLSDVSSALESGRKILYAAFIDSTKAVDSLDLKLLEKNSGRPQQRQNSGSSSKEKRLTSLIT